MSRYSGPFARDWKPRNLGGSTYHDPRDELAYWADSTDEAMVAVPVATLRAAAELQECGERHMLTHDEDGKLPTPFQIQCRKPRDHTGDHYNGYTHWRAS